MKRLRRILAIGTWLAMGGASLATVLVFCFLASPSWFLPKNALPLLSVLARTAGIYLKFPENAQLRIESLSFRDKRITIESPSLCYDGVAPHASGCFSYVYLEGIVRLAALPPRLLKLGPVVAREGKFRIELGVVPSQRDSQTKNQIELPKDLSLGSIKIDFAALKIGTPQWEVETSASLKIDSNYSLKARGRFSEENISKNFSLDLSGQGNEQLAKGKWEGWIENPSREIKRITFDGCGFELRQLLTIKRQWNLLCPAEVTPQTNLIAKEWTAGWDGKIRLLVRAEGGTDNARDPKGDVEIDLLPFRTAIVHGQGKAQFHLKDLTDEKLAAAVEANVHIVNFQKVVALLRNKPFAVPSPLNSMQGELTLATDGKAEIDLKAGRIPFNLQTKLGSRAQNFVTKAAGALTFRRLAKQTHIGLEADISLANVTLVLPTLEAGKVPRLYPDPRIQYPDRALGEERSNFDYRLRLHTEPGRPLHLVSNLAKAPVPVDLNLFISSTTPVHGTLKIAAFPVEILRRKATVRFFRVEVAETESSPVIEGAVDVTYAEYQLKLLITGTVDTPRLSLHSDPPLNEEDAYSVLVFGRPLSELSPTDGDTVANLRAAVSNRALGIASMYLLATTPIESITYDPNSNFFSARIRIADGTSLNIGGDWKQLNQLGVKRRLSPSWILNTFIDEPFGSPHQRSVSSFLEWSKRY